MKDVNSIAIDRDNFKSREEWEDATKRVIFSLLENNQIMTVSTPEFVMGLVEIEFNPNKPEWGVHLPHWLSPSEEESIVWDEDREAADE